MGTCPAHVLHVPCTLRPVPFLPRPGNSKQANRQHTDTNTQMNTRQLNHCCSSDQATPGLLTRCAQHLAQTLPAACMKLLPGVRSSAAQTVTMLPTPNQTNPMASCHPKMQEAARWGPNSPLPCPHTSCMPPHKRHSLLPVLPPPPAPQSPLPNSTSACVQNEMHLAGRHACNMF